MRRLVLALCVAASVGLLLFPTAGTPAQQTVDTDDLRLSPSPAPNGAYVTQTADGTVGLDLTRRHPETGQRIGLNERSVTTFDRLLRVEYTGSGSATVWIETPISGAHF
jgi:hypothetical protein